MSARSERGKVLVTGASGVIGTAVVDRLQSQGYDVVAVASRDADLSNEHAAMELFNATRPTAVVHLAARVHGLMGNLHSQGSMFYDNARINMNVIEAARRVNVHKIVAMGSVAMYSDSVPLPMKESDIWDGPPHYSESGYGHAKRAMLAQLSAYREQYGLDYAVALSTNLFGPRDRFDEVKGHVLPSLISKFHRGSQLGEPVVVWGTGSATRDFLYSKDAAIALQVMLEQGEGTYNLATGAHHSIRETAELVGKIAGFTNEISWDRDKPDGQSARGYDISRLTSLGWEPEYTLERALTETYDWYCEHHTDVRR